MSGRVMDKMVMLVWVYPIIKGLPLEVSLFEEDPQMAQMSSSSGSCRTVRMARMATVGLSSKAQTEVLERKDSSSSFNRTKEGTLALLLRLT